MSNPTDLSEIAADAVAARVLSAGAASIGAPRVAMRNAIPTAASGNRVPEAVRARVEPVLGADLSGVRVHHDSEADTFARSLNGRALTHGREIWLRSNEAPTDIALMAHELAHTVQQTRSGDGAALPTLQRQVMGVQPTVPSPNEFTGPLTDREWKQIELWLGIGTVGVDRLTDNADQNADVVAAAIFCSRALSTLVTSTSDDPLLCLDTGVTAADPRVRALRSNVLARGPIIFWPAVPTATRKAYVMGLLINTHHYPVNGAAGIVGNLIAESSVLPSRIEGSAAATPLRSRSFTGSTTDFTPDQVMNRNAETQTGPRSPGVGLAQWTSQPRRSDLFQRTAQGRQLGSSVLFNMDAQVEYLVSELQTNAALNGSLTAPGVSLNDASDNVVYQFEIPGSILDENGNRLPRTADPVKAVFDVRRANSRTALRDYQATLAAPQGAGPHP